MTTLTEQLHDEQAYLTDLRRTFHQHPELGLKEYWTAERIEQELDALGIPHERIGETGVLGLIEGQREGDGTIALRADIDGLPVQETNDVPYRSQNDGVMHACGHDSHIAVLLGAAKVLHYARGSFGGRIKLIFQPAEEIGYGALDFVEAGVLDGVERTFGMHAASDLPTGTLAAVEGINFAAVDHFIITVHGKGAHVSRPNLGADALYVASSIVVAVQALVARRTNPVEPVVIGIGKFHAGTTYNALAETAQIEGTTRTVTDETRAKVRAEIIDLAEQTARIFGASIDVAWRDLTPAVINPADVTAEVAAVARTIQGAVVVTERPYSLGGDNFAELQRRVPGVYAYFGTGNPDVPNTQNSHHNGNFDLDEAALPVAAALYAEYALWWLTEGDITMSEEAVVADTPIIDIQHVSKTFRSKAGSVEALKDVSLRVEKGDIYGIIGFSGAGKSTLIRLVNQLERPDTGSVNVDGRELTALSAKELRAARRDIGMVFQQFNLLERKSVYHNVAMPLILEGTPKAAIKERVEDVLRIVELEDKRNTYVSQLSGGQKQRVGIARALATAPKIMLCDEATSALDPKTTESILALLKRINRELGVTILLITHQMQVIQRICNKVAVMEDGRIVEQGSVLDLFSEPREEITQEFVRTVINDRIPVSIMDLLETDRRPYRVEELRFIGDTARKPVLSTISHIPDLEVNILGATVEEMQETILCLYLVQLVGAAPVIERAESVIDEAGVLREKVNL